MVRPIDLRHGCYTEIGTGEWWRVSCMTLDVVDFLEGSMTKEDFIKNMRFDIKELSDKLDALEKETSND